MSDSTKSLAAWQLIGSETAEACQLLDSVLKKAPASPLPYYIRGEAALDLDDMPAAIRHFESSVTLSGGQPFYISGLAFALAKAGRREESLRLIAQCEAKAETKGNGVMIRNIAYAYLTLGDKQRCYELLERLLVNHGGSPWVFWQEYYRPIESEPRFIDFVNRSGLLRYNPATKKFEPNTTPRGTSPNPQSP